MVLPRRLRVAPLLLALLLIAGPLAAATSDIGHEKHGSPDSALPELYPKHGLS